MSSDKQHKLKRILFALNFVDTPGFENENQTKPEETKIISGGGGLAKPEDIAEKIFNDSLVK